VTSKATSPEMTRSAVPADEQCLSAFQSELDYAYRTLLRLGTSPSDVEDLLQEVFLVLRGSWPEYDTSRPLRPFLFAIAYRIAFAHRRKRSREQGPVPELSDEAPSPEDVLGSKQTRRLVLAALAKIPISRRAVLMMHDIDGVPMREVAALLRIPRFTAYSRLSKARREFRDVARRMFAR
jgi:RNA polymerase sigma-70 factor, ECF subfamily